MTTRPDTAFILAAGLGNRMRPLTETRPKPLIELNGRTLIDHTLDRFVAAGITRFVINVHYLADMMRDHLKTRSDCEIILSDETRALLDSGGGIAKALPLIGTDPILKCNSDVLWLDEEGTAPLIPAMLEAWDPARMDTLLGLAPLDQVTGFKGKGDFDRAEDGHLRFRDDRPAADYLFMGLEIIKPSLFADRPQGEAAEAFSLWEVWKGLLDQGRMMGHVHHGPCLHITNPQTLTDAQTFLNTRANGG